MPDSRPDLKTLAVPALFEVQAAAAGDVEDAKRWLITINDEINERFAQAAIDALAAVGKESGTVTSSIGNGFAIEAKVDKKVEWDSEALLKTATAMPFDRAQQIFKFAVSVPEKIYAGVKAADPALAAVLDAARTTKVSAPKVTLKREG
ncbi:MAG: hypothetical protein K2Q27_15200 [Novosphingobium sp.]|nr:hypothetical protein [Novosphingobium sp.]